jgi:RND family efflux transporter MFP subunit
MPETGENLLAPPEEHPLLDQPGEERLRAEVEALRREVDELRKSKEKKHDDHPQRPRGRTLLLIGIALIVVLLLAFFLGWLPHHNREKELQREAKQESEALPTVNFIRAQPSGSTDELTLPGTTEALTDAPILARSTGYIEKRFVDIGDHVKKGQLMAIIAAPDVDQQVEQARAQLAQAEAALKQANANLQQGKANMELARVTAARYENLVKRGAVARQDNDTQQAGYQAQVSNVGALQEAENAAGQNVQASRANLQRLIELQGFNRVTAPFDGVVTLRNIDTGALISNGSTLLFRVAQIDILRTYINVPQPNAPGVRVGETAQLASAEFPRPFTGHVTRTAGALDPTTRTLLTEVQVSNSSGELRPGMFMDVRLLDTRPNPPILIPGDALIVDASGARVAVLRDTRQAPPQPEPEDKKSGQQQRKQQPEIEGTIRLQQVSIGRDYGAATEILSGLNTGDMVVVNPNDDVRDGAKVRATQTKANLDVQNGSPQQRKQSANSEKLQPEQGGVTIPQQPSRTNKKRGPGF